MIRAGCKVQDCRPRASGRRTIVAFDIANEITEARVGGESAHWLTVSCASPQDRFRARATSASISYGASFGLTSASRTIAF
jgi:hypothetical protein